MCVSALRDKKHCYVLHCMWQSLILCDTVGGYGHKDTQLYCLGMKLFVLWII